MTRCLPFAILVLVLSAGSIPATTHLTIIPSDPAIDGWIRTDAVPGTGCVPVETATEGALRIGVEAGNPCAVYRGYFSFPLDILESRQPITSRLVFYQTGTAGSPLPPGTLIRIDWIDAGDTLDPSDWNAATIVPLVTRVPAGADTGQFQVDVSLLVAYSMESHRSRLQFRLKLDSESTADGYVELESGAAAAPEVQARLEVLSADTVVAPAFFEPEGSATAAVTSSTATEAFVGVALANPNPSASRAKVDFLDSQGHRLAEEDHGLIGQNGQRAFVIDPPDGADMVSAWGNNGALQGFFMMGTDNTDWLDGIGSALDPAGELYFPCLADATPDNTQLFLFQSASTAEQIVRVEYLKSSGALQGSRSHVLSGPGTLSGSVRDLSGSSDCKGYVRVVAPGGVRGFQTVKGTHFLASLSGLKARRATRLFAPHLLLAPETFSRIHLLNLESRSVNVAVRLIQDNGDNLAETSLSLAAKSLTAVDLRSLISNASSPSAQDPPTSGHLEIDVEAGLQGGARLSGSITFGDVAGTYRSTLPLVAEGRLETLILQVAQSDEFRIFTGLALLNVGTGTAEATVKAYSRLGRSTGTKQFSLGPQQRIVDLLNGESYFGSNFTQVEGQLTISSTVPLVSFAIFGDYDLAYLSAIESQRPAREIDGFSTQEGNCQGNPGPTAVRLEPDPRVEGPLTFGLGQGTLDAWFWDDSRVESPLGGYQQGVGDVVWDLSELEALGTFPSVSLRSGNFPYSVISSLRFTVPDSTHGVATVRATASDVEGCATTVEIRLALEAP